MNFRIILFLTGYLMPGSQPTIRVIYPFAISLFIIYIHKLQMYVLLLSQTVYDTDEEYPAIYQIYL